MTSPSPRRMVMRGGLALGLSFTEAGTAQDSAQAPPAAAAPSSQVTLSCQGGGTMQASQSGTTSTYNSKTRSYESGTSTTTSRQPFTGIVHVEISGAMGRVSLPKPMVPLLSSSSEGWFSIGKLASSDREITGQVSINALNHAKLRIDRMTGDISIASGFSEFSGKCEAVHADDKPKF